AVCAVGVTRSGLPLAARLVDIRLSGLLFPGQVFADLLELLLDLLAGLGVPDLLRGGRHVLFLLGDPGVVTLARGVLHLVRQRGARSRTDQVDDLPHDLVLSWHESLHIAPQVETATARR